MVDVVNTCAEGTASGLPCISALLCFFVGACVSVPPYVVTATADMLLPCRVPFPSRLHKPRRVQLRGLRSWRVHGLLASLAALCGHACHVVVHNQPTVSFTLTGGCKG